MKGFWAAMLMAAGILIAGLSGLCSGFLLVAGLFQGPGGGADALSGAGIVLIVGGIPFLFGLGLFFWGRSLARSAKRDREEADPAKDFN